MTRVDGSLSCQEESGTDWFEPEHPCNEISNIGVFAVHKGTSQALEDARIHVTIIADLRAKEREELLEVLTEAQEARLKKFTPIKLASSKPSRDKPKDDGKREPTKDPDKR
jgi:hypothetical protein